MGSRASLRIGTVAYPGWGSNCGRNLATCQAFPEFTELLSQLGILQIAQAFSRHDDDVPAHQIVLVMAKGFSNLTFQAIALNSELDALLADHQAQTGMIEFIVAREQQDIFARSFTAGGVEDCLELSGC